MKPSYKHSEIEILLEDMMGRTTAIRSDRCLNPPLGCGCSATVFRDELSRVEFSISGMCQKCQDEFFGI